MTDREFSPVVERNGEWFIATCQEVPGANGQGRTREECLQNLAEAIALVLSDDPGKGLRIGWEEAFAAMHGRGDDALLVGDELRASSCDETEWTWD